MAEKDHFIAQLYTFMNDRGTPLNEVPTINGIDVDLYELFKVVNNCGGFNKVNKCKLWTFVTNKAGYEEQSFFLVKYCYQRYLHSFECSMLNHSKVVRTYSNYSRSIIGNVNRTGTNKNYARIEKKAKNIKSKEKLMKLNKETLKKLGKSVQNITKKEKVVMENFADTYKIVMQPETKEVVPTKSKILALNYLIDKEEKSTSNNLISSPVNIVPFDKDSSVIVGDNIAVYYGDKKDTTYDAEVINVCENEGLIQYYVHYNGWNSLYDEWIDETRVSSKTKDQEPQFEVDNYTDSSKSSSPKQKKAPSTTSRIRRSVAPLKSYSHKKKSSFSSAPPTRTLDDHSLLNIDNSHTGRENTISVGKSNIMCYSLLSEDEEENQLSKSRSGSCETSELEYTTSVGTSNIMCYSLLSEDEEENQLTESGSCEKSEIEYTTSVGTSNIMCYSLLSEDEEENQLTESGSCEKSAIEYTTSVGTSNIMCYSLLSEDEEENQLTKSGSCEKSECNKLEHVSKSSKGKNEESEQYFQNEIVLKINEPNLKDKVLNFFIKSPKLQPNNIFSTSKTNENTIYDDDDASKLMIIENDEIETDYQMDDNLVVVCEEDNFSNRHIQAQGQKFQIYSNNDTPEHFDYKIKNAKDTYEKEKTMEQLDFQFREETVNEDNQNNTLDIEYSHKVTEYDIYKPSTSKGFSDSMNKPSTSKYSFYETNTNNFSGSRQDNNYRDEVILNEAEISSRNPKSINESSAKNEQQLGIEPEKVVKKKAKVPKISSNKKSSKHSKSTTTTSRVPVLDPESTPAQRIPVLMSRMDQLRLLYGKCKKKLAKVLENKEKIEKRKEKEAITTE